MKTILFVVLLFAVVAGRLAAQTQSSPLSPTLRNPAIGKNQSAPFQSPVISHGLSPYEIQNGRYTYGGSAIELYQSKNPIKLLQQPAESKPKPNLADRLWDEGRPEGMSLVTIKF